jgi:DNA-binding NarL/FixJ family response regulator
MYCELPTYPDDAPTGTNANGYSFICAMLRKNLGLQVVGEASDGLDGVHKTAELKPDLILLDIELPTLNGIVAARQIRRFSPESKIIFVSQESSPDIVQEALDLGARDYVVKTRAAIDVLPAVEAVLEGRHFVSDGLSGHNFTDASPRLPADY